MIYILFIMASLGIARAFMTFELPDVKPLNCWSCLSFWTSVILLLMYDWHTVGIAFITYLLADMIQSWESKK